MVLAQNDREIAAGLGNARVVFLAAIAIGLGMAVILFAMGRIPVCKCGTIRLWHGVVVSSENSQHLLDWYSFSHIIHGFLFYGLFRLLRRALPGMNIGAAFLGAMLIEAGWEIAENSDAMINRYREATISFNYFGDSILNSLSDLSMMALGFFVGWRLPVVITIFLALAMEAGVAFAIRDNLTLNIIMLLWPQDWIRAWQAGA